MWTGRRDGTAGDSRPVPPETPAARVTPEPRTEGERMATLRLGTSVVIKGQLSASEDLTIHGSFEGAIEVRAHTVTVGSDAQVAAPIVAKGVVIEGAVHGDVTASDRIEIRATAHVDGAVVAPRIGIANGAWVHGAVRTQAVEGASSSADVERRDRP